MITSLSMDITTFLSLEMRKKNVADFPDSRGGVKLVPYLEIPYSYAENMIVE